VVGQEILFVLKNIRSTLGPTQPSVFWVLVTVDFSLSYGAKVKNVWSYTSNLYTFMA